MTPTSRELPSRLTAALPEGIEIIEAYEPVRKASEIKWLEVEGVMEYDIRDAAEMADAVRAFFAADAIVITKKTKRGEGELDIKPAVQSIELAPDAEEKCVRVHAVVSRAGADAESRAAGRGIASESAGACAGFREIYTDRDL